MYMRKENVSSSKLASADVPNVRNQRRAERGCVIREERRHRPAHVAAQSELWRAMISMAYVVIRPAVGEYDPQKRGTNQADSQSISPPILYICPSLRLLFFFTSQQGKGLVDRAKSHVPVSTETSYGQLPPPSLSQLLLRRPPPSSRGIRVQRRLTSLFRERVEHQRVVERHDDSRVPQHDLNRHHPQVPWHEVSQETPKTDTRLLPQQRLSRARPKL